MLRALTSFLVMLATSCLVFASLGILSWRMAVALLVGSATGAVLARIRLSPTPRPTSRGTSSRTRSPQ